MSTVTEDATRRAGGDQRRAAGDRFVAVSALAVTAILLAVQAIARELIPPLAIFGLVFAVLGVLAARRASRWLMIVITAVALLYGLGSVRFFAANLAHPESPGSFLSEVFVLLALVVVLVGTITGLRAGSATARRAVVGGAGLLAAGAVVVAVVAASNVDPAARQPDDVAIEAARSSFPAQVEVPAGGATLWIDNQDLVHHTLVIDGTDLREVLPGGTSVRMDVVLAPGTYRYLCDVPGHESMVGDLLVR